VIVEKERSLVLVKPDGVKRGLIGEIVGRIEKTGLKIIGMKMVWADEELAVEHYPITEEWAKGVFDKAKVSFAERGKEFNPEDHVAYGKLIQKWNMDFLTEGPVVAVVFEGFHAVSTVRKIVGPTDPSKAPPGTIRGDFLFESTALANEHDRTLRNLMHASGSADEAKREINLWFVPEELHEYKNIHETH
jgi:nucleoside-diphosphate kinase